MRLSELFYFQASIKLQLLDISIIIHCELKPAVAEELHHSVLLQRPTPSTLTPVFSVLQLKHHRKPANPHKTAIPTILTSVHALWITSWDHFKETTEATGLRRM